MSARRLSIAIVTTGVVFVIIGIATFSPQVALILAGATIAVYGLLAIDVDRRARS